MINIFQFKVSPLGLIVYNMSTGESLYLFSNTELKFSEVLMALRK